MTSIAALVLVALSALQADAPLLAVPKDWRHERITLPPEFAPTIAWKGVEDLSFAPGMFDTAAPGYFSYGMALSIEGHPAMDAGALTSFLETYYRGLYHAVAEGKSFTNDEAKITARVEPIEGGFRGQVSTFDAFTDGRPLALALELDVRELPKTTEILGLVSPKPADAPIWKELQVLAHGWRKTHPTEIHLNHLFFVVDQATYDALAASTFLQQEFSVGEVRTTRRGAVQYSGVYLYGLDTYLEFLPDGTVGKKAGVNGLALGVDRVGGLEDFAIRLGAREVATQFAPRTRELGDQQVTWYRLLGIEMPAKGIDVVGWEYEPTFFSTWHPEFAPRAPGIRRRDALERYAAVLKREELRKSAPFGDVLSLSMTATEEQWKRLVLIAGAAGYAVDERGTGAEKRATLTGPGARFRIVLAPATGAPEVTEVELALTRPYPHEVVRCGRAEFTFQGATATLRMQR